MSDLYTDQYDKYNRDFVNDVISDDPTRQKRAQAAGDDFVRMRLREDAFCDRVITPVMLQDSELDRVVHTDKPYKIVELEPNNSPALSVPFATDHDGEWILGRRAAMGFDRIKSPIFAKDVIELRTYRGIDIRKVVSDNAVKDISTTKDGKFIQAVQSILDPAGTGLAGQTVPFTGTVQWVQFQGGMDRNTVPESKKVMMRTPAHLTPALGLMNHVTAVEFEKWDRNEMGGDLAQEHALRGWSEKEMFGIPFIITIKRDMIPDGTVYYFASQQFLGKHYVLEDITMHIDRRAHTVQFHAYTTASALIANPAAVARVDFNI